MTQDASPEPVEAEAPAETAASPDPLQAVGPEPGIGIGTGIVVGASIGVLIAVIAAFWFGFQGPAANVVEPGADGGSTSAGTQPGESSLQRPATGADILPADKTGGGTLILQNVGNLDSVVILADDTTYTRAVYVRSGERVTIPNVAAGTYEVLMMLGQGWRAGRFTGTPLYQTLDRVVEFTERDVGSSTEYTQLTVSIEPIAAGLVGMRATEPFQLTSQ